MKKCLKQSLSIMFIMAIILTTGSIGNVMTADAGSVLPVNSITYDVWTSGITVPTVYTPYEIGVVSMDGLFEDTSVVSVTADPEIPREEWELNNSHYFEPIMLTEDETDMDMSFAEEGSAGNFIEGRKWGIYISISLPTVGAAYKFTDSTVVNIAGGQQFVEVERKPSFIDGIVVLGTVGEEPGEDVPTFSHDTAKEAGNFLSAGLANDRLDLFDRLLTDDEKTLVSGGETASVWLEAKDVTSSVASDDKAKVEGAMPNGYKLDKYLDLNLFKQIGMNSPTKITSCPGGSVTVSMDVPSELKGKACKIVRVHDGVAEVLNVTVSGDKMSFETDQFSTYALVYEGPVNTGDGMGTTATLFLITGLLSVIAIANLRKKLA